MSTSLTQPDNTIACRLRGAMQEHGITSTELARRAGVRTSFLYDVLRGKSANPSPITLAQVAGALGMELSWLISDRPTAGHLNGGHVCVPRLDISNGRIITDQADEDAIFFSKEWIKRRLAASPTDLRTFRIDGDSMEPTLRRGDTVLVNLAKTHPFPPGVFVLFDGSGLSAKRLDCREGTRNVRILPDNPRYSEEERCLDDMLVIGRVVWFARDI